MAFTNFYVQTTGNNANAGTSTADNADATSTNGSWDITADTFIVALGGVFSTVPVIGDWASIYVDGATVAVYVAQVTTVGALGVSVTLSTTAKYGTKPSASATARSCKINGAWASEQPLAAGGMASTVVSAPTKVNIKAGAYTITTNRTISWAGTGPFPLWFSGYNANPGDLDNDITNSLAKPVWTLNATFSLTTSGVHQLWTGISVVGNRTGSIWIMSAISNLERSRVENTSTNAAAVSFQANASGLMCSYCWFKCPATATTTGTVQSTQRCTYVGCVFDTGGIAGLNCGTGDNIFCTQCVFLNNTGAGVLLSTGTIRLVNCTFYGATVDGVKWTGTPTAANSAVIGCFFSGLNGSTATTNGINNASGTNTDLVFRACNDYYNVTNAEVGFGDSPAFFPKTDSSPVATSATDMTPVVGANARANGFPGIFENEAFNSYPDIGAVRHADPAAGFAGFFIQ